MKKEIGRSGLLYALFFCLWTLTGYGQPKTGHFIYNLISYEIIDSAQMRAREIPGILEFMADDFKADVYFNQEWVVAVFKVSGGIVKRMYNRKTRVLYRYYNGDEIKRLSIDSIQALKRNDKVLLAAIDTMKSDLEVMEYPKEKKRIHEYPCHKVNVAGFTNPPALDEIWVAKFPNVPDLIFPDAFYFLIEGIPLEIVQDFEEIKFKWGVVEILPLKSDDHIFKQNNDGYEVSVDDTRKLVYEGIHFIRTYEPKKE